MGLTAETHSTQVIPRDRHAMYFATLGVVASSIERLATEIRHMQRTEVREAEEFFSAAERVFGHAAQAQPRADRKPYRTGADRPCGSQPALENVALWHERDISHSSVERVFGPDATIALDFALHRMASVVDKLVVYPEKMQQILTHLAGWCIHSRSSRRLLRKASVARMPIGWCRRTPW